MDWQWVMFTMYFMYSKHDVIQSVQSVAGLKIITLKNIFIERGTYMKNLFSKDVFTKR